LRAGDFTDADNRLNPTSQKLDAIMVADRLRREDSGNAVNVVAEIQIV
jgi:hypothetical protein